MTPRFPPASTAWQRGFTFVEILAAMAFLAILIPTVVTSLGVANRAAVTAERTSNAVRLAQNQMSQLMLANSWQSAGVSGDFGADWTGYRWELSQTSWTSDSTNAMTSLTLKVLFQAQGQEREVHLTTLVNSNLTQ